MDRIYWFQKRNPTTGEVLEGKYQDATGEAAGLYFKSSRFFKYLGWSDGRFVRAAKQPAKKNKETGMMMDFSKEQKKIVREAAQKEVEFAIANEDKTPPPNLDVKFFAGAQGQVQNVKGLGEVRKRWENG